VLQTYRRAPVLFTRGEGVHLFDEAGAAYLDLISGVGVASLGHANPALAAALAEQARTLVHTSNLYYHDLQGQVASRLASLSGLRAPSSATAHRGDGKGASSLRAATGTRRRHAPHGMVALEHAFHGRTMGSLSVTWDEHYRAPFAPAARGCRVGPAHSPAASRRRFPSAPRPSSSRRSRARAACGPSARRSPPPCATRSGRPAPCSLPTRWQCGLGRTGHAFGTSASASSPISPPSAALARVCRGAALLSERIAAAVSAGDHGSTYGGNLLAAAPPWCSWTR